MKDAIRMGALVFIWALVVYVRGMHPGVHPWQWIWNLWLISQGVVLLCIGVYGHHLRCHYQSRRRRPHRRPLTGAEVLRIGIPVLTWCAIVYVRANLVENIHPWELLWCLWVLATSVAGGCVGGVIVHVWLTGRDADMSVVNATVSTNDVG